MRFVVAFLLGAVSVLALGSGHPLEAELKSLEEWNEARKYTYKTDTFQMYAGPGAREWESLTVDHQAKNLRLNCRERDPAIFTIQGLCSVARGEIRWDEVTP